MIHSHQSIPIHRLASAMMRAGLLVLLVLMIFGTALWLTARNFDGTEVLALSMGSLALWPIIVLYEYYLGVEA